MKKFFSAVAVMAVVLMASQNVLAAPKKKAAPKRKPVVAQKHETAKPAAAPARTIAPVVMAPAHVATPVVAAPAAPAPEVFKPGLKLGYDSIFDGGTLNELDGEAAADEPGSNLNWHHLPRIGWKFTKNFSLNLQQDITQFLGPQEKAAADRKEWLVFNDPYVTAAWGSVFSTDKLSIPAYIRYYVPFSRASASSLGNAKGRDQTNGKFRFQFVPIYNPTPAIELSMLNRLIYLVPGVSQDYRNIAGLGDRQDFALLFVPQVAYNLTPTFQPYLAYATGYLYHTRRTNHMSKLNHPSDGQYVELGFNYSVTPKWTVNPMIDIGNACGTNRCFKFKEASWEIDTSLTIF